MKLVWSDITALANRLRAAPFAALSVVTLAIAAYLSLVNLDHAGLWHDEAPTALIGKNLLEQGDIVGWDGRNLVGGTNGRTLNEDLRDVLPPLMYVFNAASFALLGVDETSARIVPALFGVLSLGVLLVLLRQHLADHPRLVFLAFLFAALSPQLLLFFRQSRYFAFMVFGVVAAFALYERYWQTRHTGYLVALTALAMLAFFNHYAGGAATVLSVATWHLLFRARETTTGQWLAFAASGAIFAAGAVAYLAFLGVIGGDRTGFLAFSGVAGLGEYDGSTPLVLLRVWIYLRELFTADWISWPVCLWFLGTLTHLLVQRRRSGSRVDPPPGSPNRTRLARPVTEVADLRDQDPPVIAIAPIVLMGVLFTLFSALLSVQPVWAHPFADLRYYVGALPLLLAMKGWFADWVWRRSRIAGVTVTAVLLGSSVGAMPFNIAMLHDGERTLGAHLLQFVREIHRPYPDSIGTVAEYLQQHAAPDDLVYVANFADREALTFAIGDHVLLCCALDETAPSGLQELARRLPIRGNRPDWIVVFGPLERDYWDRVEPGYSIATALDVHPYPTQRPELNLHAFEPLPRKRGVWILRRRPSPE